MQSADTIAPPPAKAERESVRISSALMDRLRRIAKEEGRMVAWTLDRLIESGLKAEGLQQ